VHTMNREFIIIQLTYSRIIHIKQNFKADGHLPFMAGPERNMKTATPYTVHITFHVKNVYRILALKQTILSAIKFHFD